MRAFEFGLWAQSSCKVRKVPTRCLCWERSHRGGRSCHGDSPGLTETLNRYLLHSRLALDIYLHGMSKELDTRPLVRFWGWAALTPNGCVKPSNFKRKNSFISYRAELKLQSSIKSTTSKTKQCKACFVGCNRSCCMSTRALIFGSERKWIYNSTGKAM